MYSIFYSFGMIGIKWVPVPYVTLFSLEVNIYLGFGK
jgi:hypothetical protein